MDILTIIRQKAETQPDQLAFSSTEEGDNVTYRQLIDRADNVAAGLTRTRMPQRRKMRPDAGGRRRFPCIGFGHTWQRAFALSRSRLSCPRKRKIS